MFQASTPHKYNTTNYVHVDEHFGTRGDYAPAAAREDILDAARHLGARGEDHLGRRDG